MDRRGFLGAILAAGVAPAIVRADSLMRIVSRDQLIIGIDPAFPDGSFAVITRSISMDEFYRLYARPAARKLADAIEKDCIRALSNERYQLGDVITFKRGIPFKVGS